MGIWMAAITSPFVHLKCHVIGMHICVKTASALGRRSKTGPQIGSALSPCSYPGYRTGDTKPNNIMVSSNGDFVLTDLAWLLRHVRFGHELHHGLPSWNHRLYHHPRSGMANQPARFSDQVQFACVIDEASTALSTLFRRDPEESSPTSVTSRSIPPIQQEMPENVPIHSKSLGKNSAEGSRYQAFVLTLLDPTSLMWRAT